MSWSSFGHTSSRGMNSQVRVHQTVLYGLRRLERPVLKKCSLFRCMINTVLISTVWIAHFHHAQLQWNYLTEREDARSLILIVCSKRLAKQRLIHFKPIRMKMPVRSVAADQCFASCCLNPSYVTCLSPQATVLLLFFTLQQNYKALFCFPKWLWICKETISRLFVATSLLASCVVWMHYMLFKQWAWFINC